MSQYLQHSKSTSYADDDDAFYLGGIEDLQEALNSSSDVSADFHTCSQDFDPTELASFKYFAGYIVSRVLKNNATCQRCAGLIVKADTAAEGNLIALKEYREGCLTHPSDEMVERLRTCEGLFQNAMPVLVHESNIAQKIITAMKQATVSVVLPGCHNIKEKIIARFCHARLHLFAKEK